MVLFSFKNVWQLYEAKELYLKRKNRPEKKPLKKRYLEVSIDTVTQNKMVLPPVSLYQNVGHQKKQNSEIMKKKQKMLAGQGHP